MTVVLIVSTSIVTAAALGGGSPATPVAVCPGARTAATATSAAPPTVVSAGAFPAQLVGHPARLRLVPVFRRWASICAIPAALVEATCWWESGWQPDVVSATGAVGLCQIEPAAAQTARALLGEPKLDRRSPSDNIEMSSAYLRWLLDKTGGRQDLALAGYYQGPTSVEKHGILAVSRPYVTGITALIHDYSWS